MPVLFIDNSNDPELETWLPLLQRAFVKIVGYPCALLERDKIRQVPEHATPSPV